MIRATLDSNIYISGLVFSGKPKRVLDMAAEGEFDTAISDPIMADVRAKGQRWSAPKPGVRLGGRRRFIRVDCNHKPREWAS